MRRVIAMACVLAMVSSGAHAQQSGAQKTHALEKNKASAKRMSKKPSAAGKTKAPAVVPVAPVAAAPLAAQAMPPIPATLMNSAPVKPTVRMEGGLLTIDAPNSTLSDVLSGVQMATGATVEGAAPSERVAVRLGPGDPRQVIAALLEGTPYDYVILGSQQNQDAVTRIVLAQSSAQNGMGGGQPIQISRAPGPEVNSAERAEPDEAATALPATEVEAEQPPQPQVQPPPPNQIQPNSPEELFRQLQSQPQPKP